MTVQMTLAAWGGWSASGMERSALVRAERRASTGFTGHRVEAAAVGLIVLAPLVAFIAGGPMTERLATATSLVWLTRMAALVTVTAAVYYRWLALGGSRTGWLCAALVSVAVFSVPFCLLGLSRPDDLGRIARSAQPGIAVALAVIVMLVRERRGDEFSGPARPGRLGTVNGAAGIALCVGWWVLDVEVLPAQWGAFAPAVLVFVAGLVISWLIASSDGAPRWFVRSLSAVIVLSAGSGFLAQWGIDSAMWRSGSSLGLDVVATGVMVYVGVRLVMLTRGEVAEMAESDERRAQRTEVELRLDQEMLHELRATLAGIAGASRLLYCEHGELGPGRSARLGKSLALELERLERLMSGVAPNRPGMFDLADAIGPVIECARANGQEIRWRAPSVRVFGRADDVAEAVHVLIANAQRHAPGSPVIITARDRGSIVEVHVRDVGPGVTEDLRSQLFTRGAKAPASVGQGLGLYVAQRALGETGAGVSLAIPPGAGGSDFVVRLPTSAFACGGT